MNDHDIARGHPPLTYKGYIQVLLSTCSTYDLQHSSVDRKKRAVYQSEFASDLDPYEDNDYASYSVDTDVADIMAYATDTTRFGNRSGSDNQSSNRIPYSKWIKMSEDKRNKILVQRKKERLETARGSQNCCANVHNVDTYVDLLPFHITLILS
jgi:hypothetical protein